MSVNFTVEVLILFCYTPAEDGAAHSVWHQFEK